jgi:hypothetical protein
LGTVTLDTFDDIHLRVRVAHDSGGQVGNHLRQEKNGTVFSARYNNLNQLLEREVTGPVRVQGNADGVLPIGVTVDGNVADTATVDQDTAAWRGDSRPIQPGQTGQKQISIVATDSAEPPKKTESVRTVELPATNPVPFSYDLNGNLTCDGLWTYTWDTENRLVSVGSAPDRGRDGALSCPAPPSEPDGRISRIRLSSQWLACRRRARQASRWAAASENSPGAAK